MKFCIVLLLALAGLPAAGWPAPVLDQTGNSISIVSPTDVHWWAGVIEDGFLMPMSDGYRVDVRGDNHQNQVQPLILSSQGDVIWSELPFNLKFQEQARLLIDPAGNAVFHQKAGDSLRDAFLFASKKYFPPSGKLPDESLFDHPQYNTWIELMYDQNQAGILRYAAGIKNHGFPAGVLMIDDNWQENYGKWDFKPGRFPDPQGMIKTLHRAGFKVMLWVCPFVSADSDVYRRLEKQGVLLADRTGQPAMVRWWNGASALLDFSNPKAVDWFRTRLDYLQTTYHVDGFKFDGGDSSFYCGIVSSNADNPNVQTELYGKIGLSYPLNEYRAMWKMGGQSLGERLSDKAHSWADLKKLVPGMILEGLAGYPFSCPDMIGGGEFTSFLPGQKIDQELIVRSAQCQALMPMMQFSVAPWRVLDRSHLHAVLKAVKIRNEYRPEILKLARRAATTGEPIVRPLEYVFPHRGYGRVIDEYMLGDRLLVAPVVEKDAQRKEVRFPPGKWKGFDGKVYLGPSTASLAVAYDDLCYFELGE